MLGCTTVLVDIEQPGEVRHNRPVVGGCPAAGLPVEPPPPAPNSHSHAGSCQGEHVGMP